MNALSGRDLVTTAALVCGVAVKSGIYPMGYAGKKNFRMKVQ